MSAATATGDERVVLVKRNDHDYVWPSGRLAVGESFIVRGAWRAWTDSPCEMLPRYFSTPALAADHLGARLPGDDGRVVLVHVPENDRSVEHYNWPSGRRALVIGSSRSLVWHAWPDADFVSLGMPVAVPDKETGARLLGARLPAPPVSASETPGPAIGKYGQILQFRDGAWRWVDPPDTNTPAAGGHLPAPERELLRQLEAQALQIRKAEEPRVVAEANAASYLRALTAAHDALTAAGLPDEPGGPSAADRIRALAGRSGAGLNERDKAIAAELLLYMEATATPEGIYLVRALRLALGIES